jgi:hypothetical protein
VSGHGGGGVVVVVVVVVGLGGAFAAASCDGEEEQALSTRPASPASASTLHASGRRARERYSSVFPISVGQS